MSVTKTVGGDRLGTGNKIKQTMHGYRRSNHDTGYAWRGSTTFGTLLPVHKKISLLKQTDIYKIGILAKTIPTIRPLYGQAKIQIDFFRAPIRLYNRRLHNDPTKAGRTPEQILFPQMTITAKSPNPGLEEMNLQQIHPSSLLYNLGVRGIGKSSEGYTATNTVSRDFNAMYLLMEREIYKQYYANKQEGVGYVIDELFDNAEVDTITSINATGGTVGIYRPGEPNITVNSGGHLIIEGRGIVYKDGTGTNVTNVELWDKRSGSWKNVTAWVGTPAAGSVAFSTVSLDTGLIFMETATSTYEFGQPASGGGGIRVNNPVIGTQLSEFPIEDIDNMREAILAAPTTTPFHPENATTSPAYQSVLGNFTDTDGVIKNKSVLPMQGLLVKTYLSDRNNNWIDKEFIEGEGGLNALTAIDVSDGTLSMNDFNLTSKIYNLLSRVAITDGTIYDFYEAVTGESVRRMTENPIYIGGMSAELMFSEVVSTAATEGEPLGSLAGKGFEGGEKGGHFRIKSDDEPSLIIGIMSITPRIDYHQGNDWDNNLKNLNELHKPALDELGFQDLLTDEFAAFDTDIAPDGTITKKAIGKQVSWQQYMTETNKLSGNFAIQSNQMGMVFARNYEHDENGDLKDGTTYIDPQKYNYAFADARREAQNIWIQLGISVTTRMLMSAKQIPNL